MKISVIVPVYNMERFVEECVNSILMQTLSDIEIICVNDGSTDSSLQILKAIQKKDTRLKILTTPNRGVANARNLGISHAVGDFVCFVDPDDFYPTSNVLKSLYDKCKGFDIVGGSLAIFDHKSKTIKKIFKGEDRKFVFDADGEISFADYQFDYGFTRFIYRRDFLISHKIYFPELSSYEDPPFLVAAMLAAGKFYAIDDIIYYYRKNHKAVGNIWGDRSRVVDAIKGIVMVLEMAKNNNLFELYKTGFKHLEELTAIVSDKYLEIKPYRKRKNYWLIRKPFFWRK